MLLFFFIKGGAADGWRDLGGTVWVGHLGRVQVGGVGHGFGVVAVVPVFDDGVEEFSKHLQGQNTKSEVKL